MFDWVPFIALGVAVVAVAISALTRSPIASTSRLVELRKDIVSLQAEILDLRAEIVKLTSENQRLRSRVDGLLEDNEYWRRKFQDMDKTRGALNP